MKVVHVLRKPLASNSVAQNVLDHGCGGLHVDASRIYTSDNLNGGAYAKKGEARWDGPENWRFQREGGAGEYKQPEGRWPANLILQHSSGCRENDTDAWDCEPGCPVVELDEQSLAGGMHSAGSSRKATRAAGKTGMFPMDGDGHRFGDFGGASRFFKQFGEEPE